MIFWTSFKIKWDICQCRWDFLQYFWVAGEYWIRDRFSSASDLKRTNQADLTIRCISLDFALRLRAITALAQRPLAGEKHTAHCPRAATQVSNQHLDCASAEISFHVNSYVGGRRRLFPLLNWFRNRAHRKPITVLLDAAEILDMLSAWKLLKPLLWDAAVEVKSGKILTFFKSGYSYIND